MHSLFDVFCLLNDYAELFLPNAEWFQNNNYNRMKRVLLIGSTGNIGMQIKNYLCKKPLSLYSPLSSELDLKDRKCIHNYLESISAKGAMCFDYIIYCALDKSSLDLEKRNIINLQNILRFQNHFNNWIHFSSRAVYDELAPYKNIPVVAVEDLPEPTIPYSRLKYKEEVMLHKVFRRDSFILRLFDVTTSNDDTSIIQRWKNQIALKGFCKNEVLNPVPYDFINIVINNIMDKRIAPGTYNLCGSKTIDSEVVMKGRTSGPKQEKTGACSFVFNNNEIKICEKK